MRELLKTAILDSSSDAIRARRRGQSLVELALILPLVLGILFAIIDFGYYLFVNVSVSHATREGVRIAAMNNRTRAQIRAWIRQTAPGVHIPDSPEAISITTSAADPEFTGNPPSVTVTVTFSHDFLVPLFMIGRQNANVYATSKSIVQTFETALTITF
ncbi:MAG: pilus assembly protein [Candidatus Wallbacteria bacterium]|nr:pilus assembly protein [Candidatus Wallbacteria bacterium]